MFTIEEATSWTKANRKQLDEDRAQCQDHNVQFLNRISEHLSRSLWDSGSWLSFALRNNGATDDEVKRIQMACGQRSFGRDPFECAVMYANEFKSTGTVEENPGVELADKINREIFG